MKIIKLTQDARMDILDKLLKRSPDNYSEYEDVVADIIANVRRRGDQAVFEYTRKFDKWEIDAGNIRVTPSEIEEAFRLVDDQFIEVMKRSASNIEAFHKKQLRSSWIDTKPDGSILGQRILPLEIGRASCRERVLAGV